MQPNIYAALIITVILAFSAVMLRLLARRLVRTPLWLDDWLTLVALVGAPASSSARFSHASY
jgi:hypothetical protein